uniref:Uncharacterized protein n=1 Tax=uncultured bacterium contig00015 TaxID=1181506 RepID=A0A806K330_9BACT|nr:hypothetical protein [uncultured bacterium contig00015]
MRDNSTKFSDFLVIFIIIAFFYGLVPIAGAFFSRYRWGRFRKRFNELRLHPLLNYSRYRQVKNETVFRFTGEIESITDAHTLWVKGEDLTIPVSLKKIRCWLLPISEGERVPEPPEQIRWNRVSTLSEGAKVYIGGVLKMQDDRLTFVSTKERPLMVIFYNCREADLTDGIIRAARTRNEYWNTITPVSLVIGALTLIYFASTFLNRPAFRLTVISSLIAIFIPLLPMIPPGLLLTALYRRFAWHARRLRAYWDISSLPMRYLQHDEETCVLCSGEKYGFIKLNSLPPEAADGKIPFLIPENTGTEKQTKCISLAYLMKLHPCRKSPKTRL